MSKENTYKENGILLLAKGKKGILHMVFGRFGIVLIALMVQFLLLFIIFDLLGNYIHIVFGGAIIFNVGIVIYLLNTENDATMKIAWLLLMFTVPVLGVFLYVFSRLDIGHRAVKKRLMDLQKHTECYMKDDEALLDQIKEESMELSNIANYIRGTGSYPIYKDTSAHYFPLGEDQFEEMIRQIARAKHFIFLEYFIVEESYMWGRILNILAQKAKAGVEVRVMYDGTCEFTRLPRSYPKKLRDLGIKCKVFFPIMPMASTLYNYRDHRKILVVDGKVAFTGGVNLSDEYINRKVVFGHWKDNGIMVKGPAVASFTMMFLQMWNIGERIEEDYGKWITFSENKKQEQVEENQDGGYIIPYGDDPLDGEQVGKLVYMDILNHAKKYVYIMTPYLILDSEMETALTFAAKRGVKVKIILPHIADKKYAFALAQTHYKALIKAGVEIYEYTPGFVHAKTFVSDDQKAVVGTINLDYRSLYHHFECAAYMYKMPAVHKIKEDFLNTLEKCEKVDLEHLPKGRLRLLLMGKLLKVLAPMM